MAGRGGDWLFVAEELLKDAVDAEHTGHLALRAVRGRTYAAEEAAAAGAGPGGPSEGARAQAAAEVELEEAIASETAARLPGHEVAGLRRELVRTAHGAADGPDRDAAQYREWRRAHWTRNTRVHLKRPRSALRPGLRAGGDRGRDVHPAPDLGPRHLGQRTPPCAPRAGTGLHARQAPHPHPSPAVLTVHSSTGAPSRRPVGALCGGAFIVPRTS